MKAFIATCALMLAVSSPSFAASDEELGHLGDKMSAAFKCSTYADMFNDQKESDRLFQIGLKAGRAFVEGMKSMNDPALDNMKAFFQKTSTDFMVGSIWQTETTKADDEIRKYYREKPLTPGSDEAKAEAQRRYRDSNCSLIQ